MSLFYIYIAIFTFVKTDEVLPTDIISPDNSPVELENVKSEDIFCANNKTKCPSTRTCCANNYGNHYCCPYRNAVCCSDKAHCCPEATSCDLIKLKCTAKPFSSQLNPQSHSNYIHKHSVISLFMKDGLGKYCPDIKHKCPGKKHCCIMSSGEFGCTVYNKGVCCPDLKTCCPHETICDVSNGKCISNSKPLTPITFKSQSSKNLLKTVVCPDNSVECYSWETCCQVEDNSYGCCEFENATCCADKVSCCPQNYKCDLNAKACIKKIKSNLIHSGIERDRKSLVVNNDDDDMEDGCSENHKCPSSQTCCEVGYHRYGCCPFENGVCCSDLQTCCPHGKTCTIHGCQ